MRLVVVAVGRVRGGLGPAVAEYEKRARRYWKLEVLEVPAGGRSGGQAPDEVMAREAEKLLARVPEGLQVVALTREGKSMDSSALAGWLEERAVRSDAGVAFLIGGAHGLAPSVLERARRRLSLSPLTLPHEMARLVLAEQLYRAGTIIRGEPYHKG